MLNIIIDPLLEYLNYSLRARLPNWQIHMKYIAPLPIRLYLPKLAF